MPQTPTLSGESRFSGTAALPVGSIPAGSLRNLGDEALVALTRAGSEPAFAEITRRYQRPLQWYCARLVGAERAQDAVQQALLQAFLSLRDRAPREISLRPWLYRIAHNCAIDLLRMGSWDYEQLDLESDGVPQPPAVVEQKEELHGLVARMHRLPEAQRRALTLRELEGCSYEEISARLGHTGSGVRQLIFRARSALRKGASALVPFGLLRERLAGMPGALEGHHMAGAAALPASSGSGLDAIGAAALAAVAVLGGVAGGVRAGHDRSARHAHAAAQPAATPRPAAPAASRAPRVASPRRHSAGRPRSDVRTAPAPPLPEAIAPAAAPPEVPPPVPAPAPAETPVEQPAPPTGPAPPAGDEATVVEQQALAAPAAPEGAPPAAGQPSGEPDTAGPTGPAPDAGSGPAVERETGMSRRAPRSSARRGKKLRRLVWRTAARR